MVKFLPLIPARNRPIIRTAIYILAINNHRVRVSRLALGNAPCSFRGMRRKPGGGGRVDGLLESSKKREKEEEDKFEEARLLEEVGLPRELLPIVVRINVGKKASEEG